ncbi:MAG: hypothetical protein HZB81_04210 [Deltaproteobacteria bacterium]|nr:hypothetical protein [Deltaproteobacteria bacterium]
MSISLYLDVCALSRPFDEQSYIRIGIETEAVNLILSKAKQGDYILLVSPVHIKELNAIPDIFERVELLTLLEKLGKPIKANRAKARERNGLKNWSRQDLEWQMQRMLHLQKRQALNLSVAMIH